MDRIGILAYGSLIDDPGAEISASVVDSVENVLTPFNVEFARSSSTRDGAPTLVPVREGGFQVGATILVLREDVGLQKAMDMLYLRESHGRGIVDYYDQNRTAGPNRVSIRTLEGFEGVDIVLYAKMPANIRELTPDHLADLAIQSARKEAGRSRKDGISYLLRARGNGIETPLTSDYERAILDKTGTQSLSDAWRECRAPAAA